MNIISLNIRGFGGLVKWRYLCETIRKEEVGMVCIQETKAETLSKEKCYAS